MLDDISQFLDSMSDHDGVVLAIVLVASIAEAAFGLGAILPGETVLVFAAVTLRDSPLLLVSVVVAAVGAFLGDHIGFLIGRRLGGRMVDTRVVRKVGVDRWLRTMQFVERRGFWIIVFARLLPGVRTLVAAAAGASPMRYRRFALASAVAVVIWSSIWILGGAALGTVIIEYADHLALPLAIAVIVGAAVILVVRRSKASA